jgi:hypothetical protein
MQPIKYALYPPAEPEFPWLAVVLDGHRPIETFACQDRDSAERVLFEMKARIDVKYDATYA